MITAFFGVPGAGKSLGLAWVARRATAGKPVYIAGFKVSDPHKKVYSNFPFQGAYKLDYSTLGKCLYEDCLILIDEIMMYSDSRDFKTFTADLKFFFSQHRKFNVDIVWTSQSYDDSDKKIRNLTNNYFLVERTRLTKFSRFTYIKPFFDIVDYTPRSGYKFGAIKYFYLPPLYKRVDSFNTISRKKEELPLPPEIIWE